MNRAERRQAAKEERRARSSAARELVGMLPERLARVTDEDVRERPDLVKWTVAEWARRSRSEMAERQRFELAVEEGPLGAYPEIDHWAMEHWLWRGAPGAPDRPLDRFLAERGGDLTAAGRTRLQAFGEARIGLWRIEGVSGSDRATRVRIREWDPVHGEPVGPALAARDLSIGFGATWRGREGRVLASYLARFDDGEVCLTGYGAAVAPEDLVSFELLVSAFSDPAVLVRVDPWVRDPAPFRDRWRIRAWLPWLRERLQLPVRVAFPWERRLVAGTLLGLVDGGDYGPLGRVIGPGREELAVGSWLLEATDQRHSAAPVLREYRAGRAVR